MFLNVESAKTVLSAYSEVCKPLCREYGLSQTALDILMFLGNNPKYKTAGEIVEVRRIKANLVSVNVDRLVNEGYLIRKPRETVGKPNWYARRNLGKSLPAVARFRGRLLKKCLKVSMRKLVKR